MKKTVVLLFAALVLVTFFPVSAGAATSSFETESGYDFHDSTLYEDAYGSLYNYDGPNAADFHSTNFLPGLITPTPETALAASDNIQYGLSPAGYVPSAAAPPISYAPGFESVSVYPYGPQTAFTPVRDLTRPDGSIGSLYIPSLSIYMNAFEGTTQQSMNRGLGHFPDTSGWNGNIGLCGHNRNAAYTIGTVKNLKAGDTLQYSTVLGTRTYSVTYSGIIAQSDWSYLAPTADNRLTLITCLADQPSLRVCVQAKEIK